MDESRGYVKTATEVSSFGKRFPKDVLVEQLLPYDFYNLWMNETRHQYL